MYNVHFLFAAKWANYALLCLSWVSTGDESANIGCLNSLNIAI
jgi:hypothetical protein